MNGYEALRFLYLLIDYLEFLSFYLKLGVVIFNENQFICPKLLPAFDLEQ